MLLVLIVIGTFGYINIEGWSFIDSIYMTVVTLSTVGFGEVHPLSTEGKIFSIILIIVGVGNMAYILSSLFQEMLDLRFDEFYRRRRTKMKIQSIKNHCIICGFGKMGQAIAAQLAIRGKNFVVIDTDVTKENKLKELDYLYVIGKASDDDVLEEAGILRAKELVTVVNSDAENVFITLTAKSLNKNLHVISRVTDSSATPKLHKAGANKIVSPYGQASLKISQSILNPVIDDFLEIMIEDETVEFQMAEIPVEEGNHLSGLTLEDSNLMSKGMIIVGIKKRSGKTLFAPKKDDVIEEGDNLIAIGSGKEFCKVVADLKV